MNDCRLNFDFWDGSRSRVSGSWRTPQNDQDYPRGPSLLVYLRRGAVTSHVVHFAAADPDLLVWMFRAGAGLAPAGVFADWLQDNEERLLPLVHDWAEAGEKYDVRASWDGVLAALRRIDSPPPDPKADVAPRKERI